MQRISAAVGRLLLLSVKAAARGDHHHDQHGRGQGEPEDAQLSIGEHQGQRRQPLGEGIDQHHGAAMAQAGAQQAVAQVAAIGI